jgi:GNAT superfamily N-acetyltransferase
MAYAQIDISEVGQAEYPLIKVLRDTIFGAYGHRFAASFDEEIAGRQDVLALIAHLEGNPVGYKLGYRYKPGRYQSWTGGVLPDYRRSGIAKRMQQWQHAWCRSRGYRYVQFNSFNKFKEMLLFGLSSGFVPIGVDLRPENELSIKFQKDLSLPDPPGLPELSPRGRARIAGKIARAHARGGERARVYAAHDDVAVIAACLSQGFNLTGMVHQEVRGRLVVRLERGLK